MGNEQENVAKLFGENVKKFRTKANLTQKELSEKLGISQKHLSIIETGTQFASASLISKIASTLGVSVSSLFGKDLNIQQINILYQMISQHINAQIGLLRDDLTKEIRALKNDSQRDNSENSIKGLM